MSDPDPTCTRSEPASNATDRSSPPKGTFLIHSNKTFSLGRPPKIDNRILGRQRRRRTSPEDHAILEAEYQRNPKPDKATRSSIVSRVTLGEKEVQIWFQNRRQNDRRRSKPLPLHEPTSSSTAGGGCQKNSSDGRNAALLLSETSNGTHSDDVIQTRTVTSSFSDISLAGEEENPSFQATSSQSSDGSSHADKFGSIDVKDESPALSGSPARNTDSVPAHFSGGKRKWDEFDIREVVEDKYARRSLPSNLATPPSLRISLSFDGEALVRKDGEKTPSPPKPRDSVRISFSADGEAVVRTANEPSPAKYLSVQSQQTRFGSLQRCASAVSFPAMRSKAGTKDTKRFGRSRDARMWESYCDNDARTAMPTARNPKLESSARLIERLENSKQTGARLLLQGNGSQQAPKRKKLARAMSSLARLETGGVQDPAVKKEEFGAFCLKNQHGDSDKENWIPGTQISSVRNRSSQNQPSRTRNCRVLGQSSRQVEAGGTPSSRFKRTRTTKSGLEDWTEQNPTSLAEDGEDVSNFVEAAGSNPEEDFDCVQGLLSLSQGAWR
ncbi:Homeobox protein yox1 [Ophidiomyces ophidiicola]|nr:Homeobox protein yox1 [Ophidiomyces ophidiicola]KAI1994471.1 Homeobox protein yox1 [Ophidiomyces ophidiicola]